MADDRTAFLAGWAAGFQEALEHPDQDRGDVAYRGWKKEQEPQHVWQFYVNGSFCQRCGASIGSGSPCRV